MVEFENGKDLLEFVNNKFLYKETYLSDIENALGGEFDEEYEQDILTQGEYTSRMIDVGNKDIGWLDTYVDFSFEVVDKEFGLIKITDIKIQ